MSDVSDKCVLLRGLPQQVTESEVRRCVDEKYHTKWTQKLHKLEDFEETKWIALFNTRKDAEDCIGRKSWTYMLQEEVTLNPDYCSDCVVPDAWKDEEYVMVPVEGAMGDSSSSFGTVDSEDMYGENESPIGKQDEISFSNIDRKLDVAGDRHWNSKASNQFSSFKMFGSGREKQTEAKLTVFNNDNQQHDDSGLPSVEMFGDGDTRPPGEDGKGNSLRGMHGIDRQMATDSKPLRDEENAEDRLRLDARESRDDPENGLPGRHCRDRAVLPESDKSAVPVKLPVSGSQTYIVKDKNTVTTSNEFPTEMSTEKERNVHSDTSPEDKIDSSNWSKKERHLSRSSGHEEEGDVQRPALDGAGKQAQANISPITMESEVDTDPVSYITPISQNDERFAEQSKQPEYQNYMIQQFAPVSLPGSVGGSNSRHVQKESSVVSKGSGSDGKPVQSVINAVGGNPGPLPMPHENICYVPVPVVMKDGKFDQWTPEQMAQYSWVPPPGHMPMNTMYPGVQFPPSGYPPPGPFFPGMYPYFPYGPGPFGQGQFFTYQGPDAGQGSQQGPQSPTVPGLTRKDGTYYERRPKPGPDNSFEYKKNLDLDLAESHENLKGSTRMCDRFGYMKAQAGAGAAELPPGLSSEMVVKDETLYTKANSTIYETIDEECLKSLHAKSKEVKSMMEEKCLKPQTGRKLPEPPKPSSGKPGQVDYVVKPKDAKMDSKNKERTSKGDPSKETEKTDDVNVGNTCFIRVKGMAENASKEMIQLFFESAKRTGGGPVVNVTLKQESNVVIVEFEKPTAVQRILEKQKEKALEHEKCTLEIEAYVPPPIDQHKLFLSGMNRTSHDCLENFVEVTCGVFPSDIIPGGREGTALLVFEEPQDVKSLREKCQSRQLEGKFLEATVVPVCSCIKLTGLVDVITKDSVMYYFEGKRGGSKEVESVDLREDRTCLVHFKNYKDAREVCERAEPIVLEGKTLKVSLYYEFMEPDPTATTPASPQIVLSDLHPQLVRFLKKSALYREEFVKEMAQQNASVEWPTQKNGPILLNFNASEDKNVSSAKANDWECCCRKAVEEFMDALVVKDDIQVAKEIWTEVLGKLGQLNISHPDGVALFVTKDSLSLNVVGQRHLVGQLAEQVEAIVADEEKRIAEENQKITRKKILKVFEVMLLSASHFIDKLPKSGVEISLDRENKEIQVHGLKADIERTLGQITEHLQSFASGSFHMSTMMKDLLFEKETRDYVKSQMKEKKVIGVWDVLRGHTNLVMYARNETEVKIAVDIVKKSILEKTIQLDQNMETLIQGETGKQLLHGLCLKHQGSFKYEFQTKALYFVAVDIKMNEITEEVTGFFDRHVIVTEFVKLDAGILRYLTEQRNSDIHQIEIQYGRLEVQVTVVQNKDNPGIKVCGKRDGCRLAVRKIEELSTSVYHEEYKMKGPGAKEFFNGQKPFDELQMIEFHSKCVLHVDELGRKFPLSKNQNNGGIKASVDILGRRIMVFQGDITKLPLENGCLVNPSKRDLSNTLGLSAAIMSAAGQDIQQACRNYFMKNGAVSEGTVLSTSPGKLNTKLLLHAVVPTWTGQSTTRISDQNLLEHAISQCMVTADRNNLSSIAIPSVGGAVFRFPLDVAAESIVDSIQTYFRKNGQSDIKDVYLCDIKTETIDAFVKALEMKFGKRNVELGTRGNRSPSFTHRREGQNYSSSSESDQSEDDDTRHELYTSSAVPKKKKLGLNRHINVSVISGELAKQQVDVIVNSTNQNLDLQVGAVSKSLVTVGGPSLQQDCKTNYPTGINIGQVAVTSGGNLKCRFVYHGCLVQWDGGQGHSEKIMKTFVYGCLDQANKNKASSIAFPALGTGVLKFPADVIANLMFDCVLAFEQDNPSTSLQDVDLVVYPTDRATVKAFQSVAAKRTGQGRGSSASRLPSQERQSAFDQIAVPKARSGHHIFNIGTMTVEVCQGDLTKETSAAIVNSVQADLDLSKGAVSKAILDAAGSTIQQECLSSNNPTKILKDGFVVTGPGRLVCQHIIHVKARSKASNWEVTVGKVLDEAEFYGLHSVAFPALGTGGKGCSPDSVAKAMFKAIKTFAESKSRNRSLRKVKILIYQKDMVDSFVNAATDGNPSLFGAVKGFLLGHKNKDEFVVRVHIYTGSSYKCDLVKTRLDRLCVVKEVEKKLYHSKSFLIELTSEQEKRIDDIGKRKNVRVDVYKYRGYISLRGPEKDVSLVEENIARYLQKLESDASAALDITFPKTWTKMTTKDPTTLVPLQPTDAAYQSVSQKVLASGYVTSIVKIERVQNPNLYTQYLAQKKQMEKQSTASKLEWELWHGTSGLAAGNISAKGFDRNYNSGSSHGVGVYFAVNPATSITGYCRPDQFGQKHIYLACVLVGDYCVGTNGIRKPPAKNPSNPMVTFDSTTDNQTNPNFFVIYHDAQAYPLYHIIFT